MNAAVITSTVGPVSHYAIRKGWQWANIYARPFTHGGNPNHGVELLINSDWGVFGYCWTHIGPEDWREFLASLNCDYAMGKLAGARFHADADVEDIFAQMKRRLVEDVRIWGVTTDEGVNVSAAHRSSIVEMRHRIDFGDVHDVGSLDTNWRDVTGRDDWIGDFRLQIVSPQVTGFWQEMWKPFADHLRQSLAAEAA